MKRLVIALLAMATVLSIPAVVQGQDTGTPDTLYFGDHGTAYGFPGGVFSIPVYVATDQILTGLSFGIEFTSGPTGIHYDSIGKFGTIFLYGDYLDLLHGLMSQTNSIDGIGLDTLGSGGASMSVAHALPVGRYKIGDFFFHGKSFGETVVVDSAYFPPSGRFVFAPYQGATYTPRFVTESMTIVEAQAQIIITTPAEATVNAGSQLHFSVAGVAAYPPVTIVLDDIVFAATNTSLETMPPQFGTNPVDVVWTPTYFQDGDWIAKFTATDGLGNSMQTDVTIHVIYVEPPCQIFRGDANCDGRVTVSDIVYLVKYIFALGPPPGCK